MHLAIDTYVSELEEKAIAAKKIRDLLARHPDLVRIFTSISVPQNGHSRNSDTDDSATPQIFEGSALERVKKFFLATDNEWIAQPVLRDRLGIKKGTACNIFYTIHSDIFESRAKDGSPTLREWRLRPSEFERLKKGY